MGLLGSRSKLSCEERGGDFVEGRARSRQMMWNVVEDSETGAVKRVPEEIRSPG